MSGSVHELTREVSSTSKVRVSYVVRGPKRLNVFPLLPVKLRDARPGDFVEVDAAATIRHEVDGLEMGLGMTILVLAGSRVPGGKIGQDGEGVLCRFGAEILDCADFPRGPTKPLDRIRRIGRIACFEANGQGLYAWMVLVAYTDSYRQATIDVFAGASISARIHESLVYREV